MSRFLITFCNTLPQGFPLAAYDFETEDLEWIETPTGAGVVGGATGICRLEDAYAVLLQNRLPGWPSTLALYDLELRPLFAQRLRIVSDGHSLAAHEGCLYVVSTGTNEVVRLKLDVANSRVDEESFWKLGEVRADEHHLNGITVVDGRHFLSMFGPDSADGARVGRILDTDGRRALSLSLLQPHSLAVFQNHLYCLESLRGQVWRIPIDDLAADVPAPFCELPGYLRGIAFDAAYMYVGASSHRLRSKSKGVLNDPPAQSRASLHCLLHRVSLADGAIQSRDLTPFGREIYDVLPLPVESRHPTPGSAWDSVTRRQLAYDREHLTALEDLRLALLQNEELRRSASTGLTVWFTGLSSAGKSTISSAVYENLRAKGLRVELLDGDVVRQHLSKGLGFSKADRDENIRRIGFLADRLTRNGAIVLVAAISPYRAIRDEMRERIGNFLEVYVNAPLEVVEQRDVKGIYRRGRAGELHGVTGLDDPYEPPLTPDVECHTDRETLEESVAKVMTAVDERRRNTNSHG